MLRLNKLETGLPLTTGNTGLTLGIRLLNFKTRLTN
jgi:hypothetical protein